MDYLNLLVNLFPWVSLAATILRSLTTRNNIENFIYKQATSRLKSTAKIEFGVKLARLARKFAAIIRSIFEDGIITSQEIDKLDAIEKALDAISS